MGMKQVCIVLGVYYSKEKFNRKDAKKDKNIGKKRKAKKQMTLDAD